MLDISNYVPGDTNNCSSQPPVSDGVCEYHLPAAVQQQLEQQLGPDGFLGMDNGEQDGRWVGRFAKASPRPAASRQGMFLRFMRHFHRMATDLGLRLMSLNSLYFPHYFAQVSIRK